MRYLTNHPSPVPETLAELAAYAAGLPEEAREADLYGEKGVFAHLEQRVAEVLGTQDAAFFPSGIMAQQCALRMWTDRMGCPRVALPDLSHLLTHEEDGPRLLHGFEFVPLTTGAVAPAAQDVAAIPGDLGAVLVELPLRDGAYAQSSFDQLGEVAAAVRERGVPLHLDGARIWEASTGLGVAVPEIVALADSVYVSFYKGLGGLAGAALAGPADFLAEARVWRRRMGGTLYTFAPHAVSALKGLEEMLPRMGEFHEHAVAIAAALRARGARTAPEVPGGVAMRVYLEGSADAIKAAAERVRDEESVTLLVNWRAADVPGWAWTELTVGPATVEWSPDEVADALVALAR